MIFIRRDRRSADRYALIRVGLFFFAAGLWLAGVVVGSQVVTAAAMGVAVLAIMLGLIARRAARRLEDEAAEDAAGAEEG